jgi:Kef-type K+ transport system membrane component KefB
VYLKLPPIIGFLLVGLGIQNILSPMFLRGAGFPFPSPASELKLIALVIVLMRAGLAIKFDEITANAVPTFLLCTIPYMAEFFAFMYIGKTYFTDFSTISMGLFASIMAPLGEYFPPEIFGFRGAQRF